MRDDAKDRVTTGFGSAVRPVDWWGADRVKIPLGWYFYGLLCRNKQQDSNKIEWKLLVNKKIRNGKARRRAAAASSPEIAVRPVAKHATLKKRHTGVRNSFIFMVLMPIIVASMYLWSFAADQYASTTGFTVRQEESGGASGLMSGLAAITGGSGGAADTDVLYEFIRSQEMVEIVDKHVDINAIYSKHWDVDPLFSLWPDATIEDKLSYWQRMVRISYDQGTGLIELRVLAFTAAEAQLIAREIVSESQKMINSLNKIVREDTMSYALADLDDALARLKLARQELVKFRTKTQIVDPEADIQGRMGVVNSLQQQLAQALVDHDLIAAIATQENDPRLEQAARQIEVIRKRIESERETFVKSGSEAGGRDYPTLIAEFENLSVEKEFAEKTYSLALAAVDLARSSAARQSRYLTAYVSPTLAETAEFPQRMMLAVLISLFMLLTWAILVLVYYSVRDRR